LISAAFTLNRTLESGMPQPRAGEP
jgi:hypothetical protein